MAMQKLYKRVDGVLHYREAWAHDSVVTEHWGVVGEQGKFRELTLPPIADAEQAIMGILRPAVEDGFSPVSIDDHIVLVIEYSVKGHGTVRDLDKFRALEERMNETLGWTGLGHCDGFSIGSGSMEVFCFVVDFEVAKRVVVADLRKTQFRNHRRIFKNEDLESPDRRGYPAA
jgi:hypothetical protein